MFEPFRIFAVEMWFQSCRLFRSLKFPLFAAFVACRHPQNNKSVEWGVQILSSLRFNIRYYWNGSASIFIFDALAVVEKNKKTMTSTVFRKTTIKKTSLADSSCLTDCGQSFRESHKYSQNQQRERSSTQRNADHTSFRRTNLWSKTKSNLRQS